MKGWQTEELNKHVRFIDYRGKTPPKVEKGIRLITAKNVRMGYVQLEPLEFVEPNAYDEWMTRGFPQQGDVLFTTEAPLGNVAQIDTSETVVIGQRLITMHPDADLIDQSFLKYALMSPQIQKEIWSHATGATVLGIKAKLLKKVPIHYPRLSEQRAIVSILDEAFEGIDAAVANAEKNLANACELFENYLNNIFTQKGDEWIECTLQEATNLITCGVAARPEYVDEGIPFLSARNVKRGKVIWENYKCITQDTHENLTKHNRPIVGDILYTRVGSVGEAAIIEDDVEFSVFVSLTLIKPKDLLLNRFLKYYLNSSSVKRLAASSLSGSGVGNLNVGTVRKFPISIPPYIQQERIADEVSAFEEKTQQLEAIYQQKLAALSELKQSILLKAFSGELTQQEAAA
jgi:type I restriction enzyme S subunit